ncbi:MAG: CRISPR-associated helicase Cas3' [Nitrospirae bacterium]|nr:CRISPR-associated helicase Cas3' [Nitrospirota bacterium]
MIFYAHSENNDKVKHKLVDHLIETARLAESFTSNVTYKSIFYLAGLLHDIGKYQPAFQRYLDSLGKHAKVRHASWGAGYARNQHYLEASIAIDGHHKGIPNKSDWKNDTNCIYNREEEGFDDVVNSFITEAGQYFKEYKPFSLNNHDLLKEVFIRYMFSALTDSDWLSTEAHFDHEKHSLRSSVSLPIDIMIKQLDEELSRKSKEGYLNKLRNEAGSLVLRGADSPCGFYSLSLPTGMGKTLTSIVWALHHVKKNDLKRIIIVLPYTSIIEQTAKVLKSIFGDTWVLEHHSNYNEGDVEKEESSDSFTKIQQRKKLACENWDYPLIVTTTVQFFESLFSNRPSRCRKVHNIAESVVIFDEVQLLRKEIILPTLKMLEDVKVIMNTSFLFCTATQPAFEKRQGFDGINTITPLIYDPTRFFKQTKRVKYHLLTDLNPISDTELLSFVKQEDTSELVIFNTKKDTLQFFKSVKDIDRWGKKYHLSTAMCPSHRKDVIQNIREDLKAKKKILVVSTQLIEAGVDFDFPVVFRAIAPLESVIQSAGRCNREGTLGVQGGRVFLFKLEGDSMPDKTYSACAQEAEELIKQNIGRLHDHNVFKEYYAKIMQLYVDADKKKINEMRDNFKFKDINDSYKIIENITEGLYIYNYNDESKRLFESVENKEFLSMEDYRKMQAFTVAVYSNFIFKNIDMCKKMKQGFKVWFGNYNIETGISISAMDADKLIV